MLNQPPQTLPASRPNEGRRTIVAIVSAAIISAVALAAVVIFDVR